MTLIGALLILTYPILAERLIAYYRECKSQERIIYRLISGDTSLQYHSPSTTVSGAPTPRLTSKEVYYVGGFSTPCFHPCPSWSSWVSWCPLSGDQGTASP